MRIDDFFGQKTKNIPTNDDEVFKKKNIGYTYLDKYDTRTKPDATFMTNFVSTTFNM